MKTEGLTLGPVETNVWFLIKEETGETVIFDPGAQEEKILSFLEERHLSPLAILLTHGHFDHIMAVPAVREQFQIPVYANQTEVPLLADTDSNLSGPWMRSPVSVVPDVLLSDGEIFSVGPFCFRMIETPGHTAGSCCYYMEEEKILFAGDTLFEHSYGRTDLPTGDEEAILSSLFGKVLTLPPDVFVYPGHGACTTIGEEQNFWKREQEF